MAEYIERQELINALQKAGAEYNATINFLITHAPAAAVAPVVHGRWEKRFEDWKRQIEGVQCSACEFEYYGDLIGHCRYCPNCGAKMDREDER